VLVSSLYPPKSHSSSTFSLTLQSTPRRPPTQTESLTNRLSPCLIVCHHVCLPIVCHHVWPQTESLTNRLSPCLLLSSVTMSAYRLSPCLVFGSPCLLSSVTMSAYRLSPCLVTMSVHHVCYRLSPCLLIVCHHVCLPIVCHHVWPSSPCLAVVTMSGRRHHVWPSPCLAGIYMPPGHHGWKGLRDDHLPAVTCRLFTCRPVNMSSGFTCRLSPCRR
jgi:hypothetical protein